MNVFLFSFSSDQEKIKHVRYDKTNCTWCYCSYYVKNLSQRRNCDCYYNTDYIEWNSINVESDLGFSFDFLFRLSLSKRSYFIDCAVLLFLVCFGLERLFKQLNNDDEIIPGYHKCHGNAKKVTYEKSQVNAYIKKFIRLFRVDLE